MTDELGGGTVLMRSLQEEMQTSYMEYAMSVIISRALPEVRDGLKPVQRRILYAMHRAGATSGSRHRKCAAFVGDVLKLYHPHSNDAVYDALVRMAQPFSLRYPLIDGQGNFGSVDGDPPAAMRYTEARLSAITAELMADIEKQTVDMVPNYDGSEEEPAVLPSRLPNLLVNGATGIAVGMTTNIPPHNLREIAGGIKHLVDNPEATGEDLLAFIKGPDFPTGGLIMGTAGIKAAYSTGHGRIIVRARHTFEQAPNGRERIIIDELPYAVNKAALVAKIAELVSDRKLEGIADLRDESDRQGMRIVIELKREAQVFSVLNNLYKHTSLQQTFGVIMLAIVEGRPVVLSLKQALQLFIDHRRDVILRRTRFDLEKAQERAHILEGLKISLDHLDEVIKTIRAASDTEVAAAQLQSKFGLSDRQARAVLALTLGRLTKLERGKIDEEYEQVIKTIAYLESVLASDQKVRMLIKEEMDDVVRGPRAEGRGGGYAHTPGLRQAPAAARLPRPEAWRRRLEGRASDRRERGAQRHPRGGLRGTPAHHAHACVDAVLHAERARFPAARARGAGTRAPGEGGSSQQPHRHRAQRAHQRRLRSPGVGDRGALHADDDAQRIYKEDGARRVRERAPQRPHRHQPAGGRRAGLGDADDG